MKTLKIPKTNAGAAIAHLSKMKLKAAASAINFRIGSID
jgi:fructose-specific component phosphotransferase system IIB-like protein